MHYKLVYGVGGYPEPELTFFKDGNVLSLNTLYRWFKSPASLNETVRGVIEIDKHDYAVGNYTFVAKNSLGDSSSNILTISTSYGLTITKSTTNLTSKPAIENWSLQTTPMHYKLFYGVGGYPEPELTFFKDGNVLMLNTHYRWFKSPASLKETVRGVIEIDKQDYAEGNYTFVANNSLGEARSDILTISTSAGLTFTKCPTNLTSKPIILNWSLQTTPMHYKLVYGVGGYPEPELTFFKDGNVLSLNTLYRWFKSPASLEETVRGVIEIDKHDYAVGNYTFVAKNSLGETIGNVLTISTSRGLTITKPPSPTSKPVIIKWNLQTTSMQYNLVYGVSGYPDPELTFFKDGNVLTLNTLYRWFKSPASLEETVRGVIEIDKHYYAAGNYTFVARNFLGNASSDVLTISTFRDLTITKPPSLTSKPVIIKWTLQTTSMHYNLVYGVSGYPDPELTFFKDGNVLTLKTLYRWFKSPASLEETVRGVIEIDKHYYAEGNYTFVARNFLGNASSDVLTISTSHGITSKPVILNWSLQTTPMHYKLVYGVGGYPEPELTFFKDENVLTLNTLYRWFKSPASLKETVRGVIEIDKHDYAVGNYSFVAKNSLGDASSNILTISTSYGLTITKSSTNLTSKPVIENWSLQTTPMHYKLVFGVGGYPEPEMTFFKDGNVLTLNTLYRWFKSIASLKETVRGGIEIDKQDYAVGNYTFVANNSLGEARSNVLTISTSHGLTFTKCPTNLTSKPIILNWSLQRTPLHYKVVYGVGGYPEPELTFFKDGKLLTLNTLYRLFKSPASLEETVRGVIEIDKHDYAAGNYTFVATNSLGNASSDILTISTSHDLTTTKSPKMEFKYPKFDGTGYLELSKLQNVENKFEFSLSFRPNSSEGLLLFSALTTNADKDFFSVVLNDGFVVFRYDCGSGLGELKSASRVKLNVWNDLIVTRAGYKGKLQLNNEKIVQGESQGIFAVLNLNLNLFVGGYSNVSAISRRIATKDQFVGCVKRLLIKRRKVDFRKKGESLRGELLFERNVGECDSTGCDKVVCENGGTCTPTSAEAFVCVCPVGFYGETCSHIQSLHVPRFSGNSYLKFSGIRTPALTKTNIEIVFKPNHGDGLLLYQNNYWSIEGYFISLSLHGGFLEFRFDLGSGMAVLRSLKPLTLGSWHKVQASRTGSIGSLKIDGQAPVTGRSKGFNVQLSLVGELYIGGHPHFELAAKLLNVTQSFFGCIQKITFIDDKLDLVSGDHSRINITPCSEPCDGKLCSNEELYRKLLYQISGKFGNVQTRQIYNSTLQIVGSLSNKLYVKPINTTLFRNKETFYVKHNLLGGKEERFILTLQYNKDRLVLLERHYFLPHKDLPDEMIGSTLSGNWSLSFFDTTRNKCGGSIYLIDSSSIETVGSLNICELDENDPPEYYLDITCDDILVFGNSDGNYTDWTLKVQERPEFPPGWRVNTCQRSSD